MSPFLKLFRMFWHTSIKKKQEQQLKKQNKNHLVNKGEMSFLQDPHNGSMLKWCSKVPIQSLFYEAS